MTSGGSPFFTTSWIPKSVPSLLKKRTPPFKIWLTTFYLRFTILSLICFAVVIICPRAIVG
jgi:hypothetical protein